MAELWAGLAPVLLAIMISPARTLAVIVLLHTPRTWRAASAFVAGMVIVMLVQGIAFGAAMQLLGLTAADRTGDLAVVTGVLYVIGGILLLTGAYRFAAADHSDGAGKLGAMIHKLETVEPSTAFRAGGGWLLASPKQWVFVNTAVAVIYAADQSPGGAISTFLVFTLLSQLAYVIVIGGFLAAEDRITPALDAMFAWLRTNLRAIAVSAFAALGLLLMIAGVATLR